MIIYFFTSVFNLPRREVLFDIDFIFKNCLNQRPSLSVDTFISSCQGLINAGSMYGFFLYMGM